MDVEQKEQESLEALEILLSENKDNICSIILEPLVQGASGMRIARPAFLKKVCERVRSAGGLIIFDEVMTGFGRTGTLFALEQVLVPDIVCLSKGLTAGFLPMSVTVSSDTIYDAFLGDNFDKAFTHGHSFTANPLGCASAIASLEVFDNENVMQNIRRIENFHKTVGVQKLTACKYLKNVRVQGTIIAVDVHVSDAGYESSMGDKLKKYFWENNALIRPLGNVIYILPPYVISDDILNNGYDIIVQAVEKIMGSENG